MSNILIIPSIFHRFKCIKLHKNLMIENYALFLYDPPIFQVISNDQKLTQTALNFNQYY